MKQLIFIFLFVFMIGGIVASSFSPSKLIFNAEEEKEVCEKVILSSDSELISVSDKWAENEDIDWKVSLFDSSAKDHKLFVNYDNELLLDERELEFCISGKKAGNYKGVLLLREEQKGNSIIQMGVWLDVTITKKEKKFSYITGAFIDPIEGNSKITFSIIGIALISLIIFYKRKNEKEFNI